MSPVEIGSMATITGMVIAMVTELKQLWTDTRRYWVAALALGILLRLAAYFLLDDALSRQGVGVALFEGLVAGLSAAGIYSGASTFREGALADKANRPSDDSPANPQG